ncbi:BamA/TamA family outer membrane protein [bacterium]|nr:BamA/TamA family outer membrane protein [bacterium]
MKRIYLIIIAIAIGNVWGQYYFGQNKIQAFDYEWKIFSTPHFDIYYYPEEQEIVNLAGKIAEDTWSRYTAHFGFAPNERIPIIIYSSPALFSETHTTPFIIPEGIGGFTEFIKGRVIIPYDGSIARFEHILPHELVHIWQIHYNEYLHDAHELFFLDYPPLWFVEGQAEFLSQSIELVDERTEIIAAIANDRFVLPKYFSLISGTYQMYKEGENFLRFLSEKYGYNTDIHLFERVWEHGWFDVLFKRTMGISLDDAGLLWRQWILKKYGDYIAKKNPAQVSCEIISPDGFFFSPVQIDSNTIICKGNRMGYAGIYRIRRGKASLLKKIELTTSAEATRLYGNRISLFRDSLVAFSAKSHGKDRLFIFDMHRARTKKFDFDNLVQISSPMFDIEGDEVIFSASNISGFYDIYRFNIVDEKLEKITDDIYYDYSPVMLDDGSIIFVSDKFHKNRMSLVEIHSDGGIVNLDLPSSVFRPRSLCAKGDTLLFVADDDTFPDVYLLNLANDSLYKITDISEPIYDVNWGTADTILVSNPCENNVVIGKIPIDTMIFIGKILRNTGTAVWQMPQMGTSLAADENRKKPDAHHLTFDLAQGEIGMVSSQQAGGGLEIALSDMVGDKRVYAFFQENAQSFSDLLSEANVALVYTSQGKRWSKNIGAFHFNIHSYNRYEGAYDERQIGLMSGASYAITRFTRLDGTSYIYYSDKSEWSLTHRKDGIVSANISLIRDNSLWGITGPVDGMRANITAGSGIGVSGVLYHYLLSLDLRDYLRLSRRSCWAHRLVFRHSDGKEPQRFYMGGTWDFRGYPYFYFFGKNQALFNSEIRFPLIDRFVFATPLANIDIRGIRGALFFDAGDAWEDKPDFVGSFGIGARMNLDGYVVLRLDFAQTTDFHTIDPHWKWDIFFGWDF